MIGSLNGSFQLLKKSLRNCEHLSRLGWPLFCPTINKIEKKNKKKNDEMVS